MECIVCSEPCMFLAVMMESACRNIHKDEMQFRTHHNGHVHVRETSGGKLYSSHYYI